MRESEQEVENNNPKIEQIANITESVLFSTNQHRLLRFWLKYLTMI